MNVLERIENKYVAQEGPIPGSHCHIWTASVVSSGHPAVYANGTKTTVTRTLWRELYGEVPSGWRLHNVCGNKLCVNLAHYRLEHIANHTRLNMQASPNHYGNKTYCKHGHAFTAENTYHDGNQRHCRACTKERSKRHYIKCKMSKACTDYQAQVAENVRQRWEHHLENL